MNNNQLEVGDMIAAQRVGFKHVGVYIGPQPDGRDVIHNNKFGGVALCTFAEFANGDSVSIHQKAKGGWFERHAIVRKAHSLIGQKYDLFTFNCEQFANLVQRGMAESPQLQGAAALGVVGLLFVALVAASEG